MISTPNEATLHPTNLPPDGTKVTAQTLSFVSNCDTGYEEEDDVASPAQSVTGTLTTMHVRAPWGDYTQVTVDDGEDIWSVDPTTVEVVE